jgi:hypothetical protein
MYFLFVVWTIANLWYLNRSSAASRSSPANLRRTWQPNHGIVFNPSVPYPRLLSTVIATDSEQNILLHSTVEDDFLISRAGTREEEPTTVVEVPEKVDDAGGVVAQESALEDPDLNELPQSTIAFKMTEETFQSSKKAEPGSAESYWSHTLYRGPAVDEAEPKVKVHYCRSKHTTERVCQQYFQDKEILGFDIEWKPEANRNQGAKKNVSLIQLASEERIALFHIALYPGDKLEDLVAPSLKKIMEDASITKVGVAIKADCTRLRKFLSIDSKGLFELSHLYKLVKYSHSKEPKLINKRLVALAVQVQEHLHLPLFKGDVRSSDWSLPVPLQMDQIIYSASDSYAGVHLYDILEMKRKALNPMPPRPYHVEEGKPIRLAPGVEIPTDEDLEPEESEPVTAPKGPYKGFSSTYLASVLESLEIDPDVEIALSTPTTSSTTPSKPTPTPKSPRPISPLVQSASTRTETYRSTHPRTRATPSSMRCYFLWCHNPSLSLPDIAALLRETPLQTSTVINYILETIRTEKLPYERERLREVLGGLPAEVVKSRYRALARDAGVGVDAEEES